MGDFEQPSDTVKPPAKVETSMEYCQLGEKSYEANG